MSDKKLWKNCNRFSEKLGQKILQLGLNGQKLARKSDVSDSEISRIMNGKSLPGLENAIALARAVGVSLDYLADDTLETDPAQPKESANEREMTILRIAREIGYSQTEFILETTRQLAYDVAAKRLLDSRPVITPLTDGIRPTVTAPLTNGTRVTSA